MLIFWFCTQKKCIGSFSRSSLLPDEIERKYDKDWVSLVERHAAGLIITTPLLLRVTTEVSTTIQFFSIKRLIGRHISLTANMDIVKLVGR